MDKQENYIYYSNHDNIPVGNIDEPIEISRCLEYSPKIESLDSVKREVKNKVDKLLGELDDARPLEILDYGYKMIVDNGYKKQFVIYSMTVKFI